MKRFRRNGRSGGLMMLVALASVLVLLGGCDTFVPAPEPNTPVGNFEALWNEFDARYALFDVRHVNWDSLYVVNRPRVHAGMDGPELFDVMCSVLAPLRDSHVGLQANEVGYFSSYASHDGPYFPDGDPDRFALEVVQQDQVILNRYLAPGRRYMMWCGQLPSELSGSRVLTYLRIIGFGDDDMDWDTIHRWMTVAPAFDGLIIDLRGNHGGMSFRMESVAGQLLDRTINYATVAHRNGPGHGDFTPPVTRSVSPRNAGWAALPVVVVTDHYTVSAAEHFVLVMRQRPGTTIIGDRTNGSFSSRYDTMLPNGWCVSCSSDLVRDVDGVCWEGIGLTPEIHIRNTKAASDAGRDLAIDLAITLLGGPSRP